MKNIYHIPNPWLGALPTMSFSDLIRPGLIHRTHTCTLIFNRILLKHSLIKEKKTSLSLFKKLGEELIYRLLLL